MNKERYNEIKAASRAVESEQIGIMEKINRQSDIEKPLDDWAEAMLRAAISAKGHTMSDFERFNNDCDHELAMLIRNKNESAEARLKAMTYYEDEYIRVTAVLDYDYGYKLSKYTVTNKQEEFAHRSAYHFRKLD